MAGISSIDRLLIRTPNWLGDAVMAIPAIRYLRKTFSNARVTLVCRQAVAGLFEGEDLSNEIMVTAATGLRSLFQETRELRSLKFDLAVLMPNSAQSALHARMARARRIAGYATDRRGMLLTDAAPLPRDFKSRHQVDYYLDLAKAVVDRFGVSTQITSADRIPRLYASEADIDAARLLLTELGIPPDSQGLLLVSPGATNSRAKRWLPERFAEAADRLSSMHLLSTVLVGTTADLDVCERVASSMKTPGVIAAGKTTIPRLKALLALSRLVISNDNGTAHMAAAMRAPCVVIFGPTEHFFTQPLSESARIVRRQVECSPCMLRDCPIDHRCMTGVSVDDVLSAAAQVFPPDVVATDSPA